MFPRFPRCAMRTAGQRVTLAAQERWSAISWLLVVCSFYGDKVGFSGSLFDSKREHPRNRTSLQSAAFTSIKLPFLVLFWASKENAPFPYLLAFRSIFADKVASFGSFLGYRKEHPRIASFCGPRQSRRQNRFSASPNKRPPQAVAQGVRP